MDRMTLILHSRAARWLLATAMALIVVTATAPMAGADGHTKLIVGKPTKTGDFTIHFFVKNGDGVRVHCSMKVRVSEDYDVGDKLLAICSKLSVPGIGDTIGADCIYPDQIRFHGSNGWTLENLGDSDDQSGEPDELALGIPPAQQDGLCSLKDVATGRDVHGQPAYARLRIGPADVRVPTQPGMPAVIVEQMLIQQLNASGVPARFATPDDFQYYESLPHDENVIWFPIADTTGFRQEITDTGLSVDLADVLNNSPGGTAGIAPDGRAVGMRLEVYPSLFRGSAVDVRYAAASAGVRLEVFDVAGRRVRTLLDNAGAAEGVIRWDGRDGRDVPVADGLYLVRFETPHGSLVRRVVRIRN